jgi:hypothetical protein
MILETIRIVSEALENGTYGVNAQLSSLDIDSGDTVPTNIVKVGNETEDFLVAMGRVVTPLPSLNVALDGDVDLDPEVMTIVRDGDVVIAIRVGQSNDQAQNGMRDTYYYLRAIQKTLRDLSANGNIDARTRNNICVGEITEMIHRPLFREIEDTNAVVTGQLIVTYRVRDNNP